MAREMRTPGGVGCDLPVQIRVRDVSSYVKSWTLSLDSLLERTKALECPASVVSEMRLGIIGRRLGEASPAVNIIFF